MTVGFTLLDGGSSSTAVTGSVCPGEFAAHTHGQHHCREPAAAGGCRSAKHVVSVVLLQAHVIATVTSIRGPCARTRH